MPLQHTYDRTVSSLHFVVDLTMTIIENFHPKPLTRFSTS